ncbi:MAG: putative carboxypeptidase [Bacteriovoracaceae bacterium]|nr:putative carboxypeptidase [Bacteriovoracaceae bacterium]
MRFLFLISFVFYFLESAYAFHSVEEGVFVNDPEKFFLKQIESDLSLTIDHVSADGYEVYGPNGLKKKLLLEQILFEEFSRKASYEINTSEYPTFEDFEGMLKSLHEAYPNLTVLSSIGKSTEGRNLWVMKISNAPLMDQGEPKVKYISSMHGDEITGREVLVLFMQKLLANYQNGNLETRELIDNTEIYIMPSMNPDGSVAHTRANHNHADLNRDFPDFSTTDNQNSLKDRQPETQAVMKFQAARKFALSANFHGGSEVVNYMWDAIPEAHPFVSLLKSISLNYASRVPYISHSEEFPGGITNGFQWYQVNGGMQDWSYHWYGDTQFTIELSRQKWPPYSEMQNFYSENESALFQFLKMVHQGAGFKYSNAGVSGFTTIKKRNHGELQELGTYAFSASEFYKVLEPGDYMFSVAPNDGQQVDFELAVASNTIYLKGNYKNLN